MTDTLPFRDALRRLRENPADTQVLTALLDHLEAQERAQFKLGELYEVAVPDTGKVTKELAAIGERCCIRCLSFGCPGQLIFRDGSQVCPQVVTVKKAVATDPFTLPLQLIQRLLYRGLKRGSVELFDGRTVTFTIKAKKDA